MTDQAIPQAAIVVVMPADIDYGTADQAYARLHAALTADAAVIIAGFTDTSYCDCAACWPSRTRPPPAMPNCAWPSR